MQRALRDFLSLGGRDLRGIGHNTNDSHLRRARRISRRHISKPASLRKPTTQAAFQTVFECYYRELLSFLSRRVADRVTAADLAQESYARVYAVQQAGETVHDPRALLYRTARNLVIDQGRRRDVRARHAEPEAELRADSPADTLGPRALEPDAALESQQMVDAMLATIDRLPPRCRQAFILHKFDGLSHAAVAAHMGVSVKMVEQHVKTALQACRRCRQAADGNVAPEAPLRRRTRTPE